MIPRIHADVTQTDLSRRFIWGYANLVLMVWDEPKRLTNLMNHHLDFTDARDRFDWSSAMIVETYADSDGRVRFAATGALDASLVTLIFSPLGTEAISAVSLRPASRRERRAYAKR